MLKVATVVGLNMMANVCTCIVPSDSANSSHPFTLLLKRKYVNITLNNLRGTPTNDVGSFLDF